MFRPIPWGLVPGLDIRATEKSFTIKIGNNKPLQIELLAIVRLVYLLSEARDFFYTTLHRARRTRAQLKRSYRQHLGQIVTIAPAAWCILVLVTVIFSPLTFAGIAMVLALYATRLVLHASYEAAQIIARVTRRLLDGPVQTFISIIWNLARSVQPLLVERGGGLPRIQLNIQPNTPECGQQSPPGHEQTSPSQYEQPIPRWFEQPISRGRTPPSDSGVSSESVENMFRNYGQLPRPVSLSPLPKARKRAAKAIMNRRVMERN
ncbi:hypothetical protein B0I37DRAFT_153554 [Chaetomium sp. MPI-CAGE-AT-0009]|nr:hypothetical protein B0I37DRAFT_153554 [Chaetomium sp. MPI-CAGE-AT-0009]